jgi:putative peptidoglycan lipid II flippase
VSRLIRIGIASAVLGAVLVAAQVYRPMIEAPIAALTEHGAKEIALVLTTGVGGLVYLVLLFLTRAVTIGEIKGILRRERRA